MKRCTRCLYPDTKPDLHFDEHGVCSACRAFDKRKEIDWKARESELLRILETKNDSGYDCIVPSSGGKDSHWQVLKLIELGVKPLVVTATTCHLTEIGRANIDNLARYATTIEVSPNKTVRAKLNRAGLDLVGDISWPEHVSIFTTPFRVACDLGIPLIFYGECPQNQYGGPPGTEEAREMTLRWTQEFGGFLGLRPSDMVGKHTEWAWVDPDVADGAGCITEADMADYELPSAEEIRKTGVTAYFLGQFYEWDSWRNAEIAREAGMKWRLPSPVSWWKFENLDNAQTGLHDHMMELKFGYGRAVAQLSVDIRAGRISREKALWMAQERESFGPTGYMGISLEHILRRIGMTRADYDNICARHECSSAA